MSEVFLIDGYNLIHFLGLVPAKLGPGQLEKARLRLLDLLRLAFGEKAPQVTIVFDASRAPRSVRPLQEYQGLKIYFAPAHQEADDVIEELLDRSPAPRHLTVVSNDHRLQQAARRSQARLLTCGEFLDLLQRRHRPPPDPAAQKAEGKGSLSPADTSKLMEEFRHLDRELQEFFDPFDFYGEADKK